MAHTVSTLQYSEGLETLLQTLLRQPERILLFGPPGAGKSYLATELAKGLLSENQPCACLCADPGSPGFGIPAAINLGVWHRDSWQPKDFEALCSLDAARFRLPLTEAIRRLILRTPCDLPLIIDAPGLSRGVAAAELLTSLIDITAPTQLVILDNESGSISLNNEIACLSVPVLRIASSDKAKAPNRRQRAIRRTELWEQYLTDSSEITLEINKLLLLGTPPPVDFAEKWAGLLIALSDNHGLTTMGEVLELKNQQLRLRCPPRPQQASHLLVRDARHLPGQQLITAVTKQTANTPPHVTSGPSIAYPSNIKPIGSTPQIRRRDITAELINGLFDDPLLLIKTNWSRRCLLFDLGNTSRLPLRHAHNVSHIFITHAHFDHIGGFMGLLRIRLGTNGSCALYGPPGLARHIAGMISGILWDRIGENGPVFDVAELHGDQLHHFRLQAGHNEISVLQKNTITDGIIHREERFIIRAVELDHGTPVLAYAYEPVTSVSVSKQALKALNISPGPWLGQLKYAYMAGEQNRQIKLPNDKCQTVRILSQQLLLKQAGNKLVYATDLANTAENREKLIALARHADTLFCEAAFTRADVQRGIDNSHLTTKACGEIAAEAEVKQLVPFHFSRRYEDQAEKLYREVEEEFSNIVRSG